MSAKDRKTRERAMKRARDILGSIILLIGLVLGGKPVMIPDTNDADVGITQKVQRPATSAVVKEWQPAVARQSQHAVARGWQEAKAREWQRAMRRLAYVSHAIHKWTFVNYKKQFIRAAAGLGFLQTVQASFMVAQAP